MKTSRAFLLLALCAGFSAAGTTEQAHAQSREIFVDQQIRRIHAQDVFMQRIESHLAASTLNYVTAYVTLHTAGWAGNNFTAFAEVPLNSDLRGAASYVFSDRLGYPWGTAIEIASPPGGFGGGRVQPTMHFDPYQAEGDTLSIDLGYAGPASVYLGLWGMDLTDYTINPTGTLIYGYLNGNPDWLATVTVSLDARPVPPR